MGAFDEIHEAVLDFFGLGFFCNGAVVRLYIYCRACDWAIKWVYEDSRVRSTMFVTVR